ncbi:TetR/AcrR family transcriptional regulator [Streptococcus dentiloxodontae]
MKAISFMMGNAQMKNKLLIVYTLERLLKTMTFSDITVKKLIAESGVSRSTFYRNFKDKYDVGNWYFRMQFQKVFDNPNNQTLKDIYYGLSLFMGQEDRDLLKAMVDDIGQNNTFDFISDTFYDFWKEKYEKSTGYKLSESQAFQLAILAKGGVAVWKHILKHQKVIDPQLISDNFVYCTPDFLKQMME